MAFSKVQISTLMTDSLVGRQSVLSPVDGAVVLAIHVLKHRVLQGGRTTVRLCLLWIESHTFLITIFWLLAVEEMNYKIKKIIVG